MLNSNTVLCMTIIMMSLGYSPVIIKDDVIRKCVGGKDSMYDP